MMILRQAEVEAAEAEEEVVVEAAEAEAEVVVHLNQT
jgi:hypothetical protein